jgi:hypothetical protein
MGIELEFYYPLAGILRFVFAPFEPFEQRQREEYKKKFERDNENRVQNFRATKPGEYITLLQEQYKYFVGPRHEKNKIIYELSIENNYPVLTRIDILDGEKIRKERIVFNETTDPFQENPQDIIHYNGYEMNFNGENAYMRFDDDKLAQLHIGDYLTGGNYINYYAKDDYPIPDEVMEYTSDYQRQYIGEYLYQNTEVLTDNKGYFVEAEANDVRKIVVALNNDGRLNAECFSETGSELYEFIVTKNDAVITSSSGDGHSGSLDIRYYIENNYIIFYYKRMGGYFEGGDGYTVEYKIYFKLSIAD